MTTGATTPLDRLSSRCGSGVRNRWLTNFIVAECHALSLSRLGADIARKWLLGNIWPVERVNVEDETKARVIIEQYTDKTFSYTDATSFAVMDRLGIKTAFGVRPPLPAIRIPRRRSASLSPHRSRRSTFFGVLP